MLIPIRTDRPRLRPAYLTVTLIVINTLVQVYSRVGGTVPVMAPALGGQIERGSVPQVIYDYGLWGSRPTLSDFFTHMFVHGDELHLIGNMLFLWIFGSLIEDAIRPWGLAALYLGGGIMAALTHIGMSQILGHELNVPMVGASGAIAAIMGLFMLRFYKTRVQIFYFTGFRGGTFWVAAVWALLYWIVMEFAWAILMANLFSGGGGVAHWAHIGGFAAGAIAAPFLGSVSAARREYLTGDPATNVERVRRTEEAAAAEKALRAAPGNPEQMRRLAQAYRRAGDVERATGMYLQSIHRFAALGQLEHAGDVYVELVEFNDAAVPAPDVHVKLAQQLEESRPPQALSAYRHLVTSHPTRPEAEFALLRLAALNSQKLNRPFDALRCLNEFLQRYPESQWAGQARQARDALDGQLRLGR